VEKLLIKMAEQLAAFDEDSLTSLWDKYEDLVRDFQPTKKWEQAVLVLGMIQTLRWKNHLFNHHWAARQKPEKNSVVSSSEFFSGPQTMADSGAPAGQSKPAKVLPFVPPNVE
jgi:hypothetical protein